MKLGILAITTIIINFSIVVPVSSVKSQEPTSVTPKADLVQNFITHAHQVAGDHR